MLLELGGKAPLVVLDDADIDGAVNAAVFGSFLYQGQICMSTERFVVDESDRRRVRRQVRGQSAASQVPGTRSRTRGLHRRTDDPRRVGSRINRLIDDAVAKGAELVAGGRPTVRPCRRRSSTR